MAAAWRLTIDLNSEVIWGGRYAANRASKGFRGLIAQTGLVVQPLFSYRVKCPGSVTSFRFYRGSFRDFDRDRIVEFFLVLFAYFSLSCLIARIPRCRL